MSNFRGFRVLCGVLLALAALANPRAQADVSALSTYTVTDLGDSGAGTFRQAILDANTSSGPDTIVFNIPGAGVRRIQPLTPLPSIDDALTIDGATQPGYTTTPLIEISGVNLPNDSGLVIHAQNCKVRALAVNGFGGDGIAITGSSAHFNRIEACFVGTDPSGTIAQANGTGASEGVGIRIGLGPCANNVLFKNVISGNADGGVSLDTGANTNYLESNWIGTDHTGTVRIPNGQRGVIVQGEAHSNRLLDNLISGNDGHGLHLSNSSTNVIIGNAIGVNAAGTAALDNQGVGIYLTDDNAATQSADNQIGGENSGEGNLISGNFRDGIRIEGLNVARTLIRGNVIGTTVTGDGILANGDGGVAIINSADHTIGGTSAIFAPPRPGILGPTGLGPGNLLSGNADDGIFLFGPDTSTIRVEGNLIGTTLSGNVPLANVQAGVAVRSGVHDVTIRKNVISGNTQGGITIDNGSHDNLVTGNRIGTNAAGTAAAGQGGAGLLVQSSAFSNLITSNVISGNGGGGIGLLSGASLNRVFGNRVGVNAAGTAAIPNNGTGIAIEGAANAIGDAVAGGNLISGNTQDGISIHGIAALTNKVRANLIGVAADRTSALGNGSKGIVIRTGASQNQIGGTNASDQNVIAFNNQAGVVVGAGSQNSILGNEIRANGGLGIDLNEDAVTLNDAGDGDGGANNSQNFPVLTTASSSGGNTTVSGSLDSTPNTVFRVEYFGNVVFDASGFGEGEKLLGASTATTNSAGHANLAESFSFGLPDGFAISATATDSNGNTSEFSAIVRVNDDTTPPSITNCLVTPTSLPSAGGAVTIRADVTDASGISGVRAQINIPGPSMLHVTMTRVGATDTFQTTYTAPPNSTPNPQSYGVVVEAMDTRGNPGAIPCGGFVVAAPDTTPPFFSNCQVSPRTLPSSGGGVILRVDATDPSGVAVVRGFITVPGGGVVNVPMSRVGATDTFQGTYSAPPNPTSAPQVYNVKYQSEDSLGNGSTIPCGDIQVVPAGSSPPSIESCSVTPTRLPDTGGAVAISADVTDSDGVKSVQARISLPNGAVTTLQMVLGAGSTYSATYSAPPNTGFDDADYTVFILAKDMPGGSSLVRCGTFTVAKPDRTPPTVSGCQVQPRNLPAAGGAVVISANVTDNIGVTAVEATITLPGGGTTTATLAPSGNSYSVSYVAPPNGTGVDEAYQVSLVARDAAGNSTPADCGGFRVLRPDSQAPLIVSCEADPRTLLSPGGVVRLRANVTDNAGIDRVEARITRPDLSVTTVTLAPQSGSLFEGTFTAPANGTAAAQVYAISIDAVDTSGNGATADCGSVTVAPPDNMAPVIRQCQVAPRALLAAGGEVLITADVVDDVAVSAVRAIVTRPDGSLSTLNLARVAGPSFAGRYTVPPNSSAAAQDYRVEIRAQDSSGNVATVDCGVFTVAVRDPVSPTLLNCAVSPRSLPAGGGDVTVTADALDNVAVKSVVAEFIRGDGSRVTLVLQASAGSGYSGTVRLPANAGDAVQDYRVVVTAEDPSANSAREECGNVVVAGADRQPPAVANCTVVPGTLAFAGGTVTVSAEVTDASEVASVTARVLRGGTLVETISLAAGTAPVWSASFAAHANRTEQDIEYVVELIARDAAGNARTIPCGTFTVLADTAPPAVLACDAAPRSLTGDGGPVVLSAIVTDRIPLARVHAVLTLPDGTTRRVPLLLDTGDRYAAVFQAPENNSSTDRSYTVTIEAEDIAGNRTTSDCGVISVARATGGRVQVSVTDLPFGRVQKGTRFRRQFVIRNVSGDGRLAVTLPAGNAPFSVSIPGAAAATGPRSFSLASGGIATVTVDFAPDAIRRYADRLVILTSDPRKPEVRVKVSGLGCRNGR